MRTVIMVILNKKVEKIGNPEDIIYTFVPKGFFYPSFTCIPYVENSISRVYSEKLTIYICQKFQNYLITT